MDQVAAIEYEIAELTARREALEAQAAKVTAKIVTLRKKLSSVRRAIKDAERQAAPGFRPAVEIRSEAEAKRHRVAAMRAGGMTYAAIGAEIGCSAKRAAQIMRQHERNISARNLRAELHATDAFAGGLSVRVANCLRGEGLFSFDDVRAFYLEHGMPGLLRIPNMGRKGAAEVVVYIERQQCSRIA